MTSGGSRSVPQEGLWFELLSSAKTGEQISVARATLQNDGAAMVDVFCERVSPSDVHVVWDEVVEMALPAAFLVYENNLAAPEGGGRGTWSSKSSGRGRRRCHLWASHCEPLPTPQGGDQTGKACPTRRVAAAPVVEKRAQTPEKLTSPTYRPELYATLSEQPAFRQRQVLEHLMRPDSPDSQTQRRFPRL